ncbi:NADH dehydrogenase [ubiquinone] 1 alpha subcomplex subunit 9, mitochondrial [Selaginella moellendorffii]|uniref:NADH dehydrogenase [ubiquinone] 1 alpha subcomplex subunit 9, mitochondrial n=1 Tax=Selaginella moellendorffii TaxID=88036 RepID=UPI000D1D0491|nr:NADH dehydrogenase [ubiquinone] 1 alpha subcomplex subunit 9, mitochondrial [Selaginella moellendorffii]|eukprot:XP_024536724.1 NADH dehydrogenase [ubiquinone] 1 alpha subcomplex subunit 9, mitochondrial [Selaginella moellendorffii]
MASSSVRALRRGASACQAQALDFLVRGLPASRGVLDPYLDQRESSPGVRHAFNLATRGGTPLVVKTAGGLSAATGFIVTIFGSTGMLGRAVVNNLAKIGAQCMIPYRGLEDKPRHLKVMGDLGQIVPFVCNIRDEDAIRAAIAKSNVVINLIGREYETRNYGFEEVNIDIAQRIARISKEHGGIVRYIHTSCVGADENSPSKQHRTKALGEEAVRQEFPEATIMRPASMFGYHDKFLNRFATKAKFWPNVPMFFDGKTRVQPVCVLDVAAAFLAAVKEKEGIHVGKVYELGGPDVYTIHELLLWMFEVLREKPRIINIPLPLAEAVSRVREFFFKRVPVPLPQLWPCYRHYIDSLKVDQVVSPDALTFEELGIKPRPLGGLATEYLFYYREGGPHMGQFRL